jgi:hypothetical protein
MLMGKISKTGIVSSIVLVFIVLGFVIWNGSAGSNEKTSATTTTTIVTTTTTTTIPQVAFIATHGGGIGSDVGYRVSVTSDGGAIITGGFTGTATFGPTTLTSSGEEDVFVGKVSSAGRWDWVIQAGGTGDDFGSGIEVTSDGGAIVTGEFTGTATFGPTTLTSSGEEDVFVGKISSTGTWDWVIQAGGTGMDFSNDASVLSDGASIITGTSDGAVTFGSVSLPGNGSLDVFVGKVSSAGVWEWVTQTGSTSVNQGMGVVVSSDGGAIITGYFSGTATFGSTSLTSSGDRDVFVGKVSPTGEWEWVIKSGGTGDDAGWDVVVSSDGVAIITGYFSGTATFGSTSLTSSGDRDAFVGKVSPTGVWEWVTQSGGTGDDVGAGVVATFNSGAIITGYFSGTATFGSTSLTSSGDTDVFVGKISLAGVWEWVNQTGDTGGDFGWDVVVTADDGAIITGEFSGRATFGSTALTSNGDGDIFAAKISSTGVWDS